MEPNDCSNSLPKELLRQPGMRTQAECGGIFELRRWSWESGETKAANLCRVSTQSTVEENITKGKSSRVFR